MRLTAFARDAAPPADAVSTRPRAATRLWVALAAIAGGIGWAYASVVHRTQLVAQIDPNLHAFAIFLGMFGGVLASAGYARFWWRDRPFETDPRRRSAIGLVAAMIALPVFGCIGASYGARRLVEWRAFHGLAVPAMPAEFTVAGTHANKGSLYVDVIGAPGGRTISLPATTALFREARVGDHVTLPVETGRGGVRRVDPAWRVLDIPDRHSW